MFWDEQLVVDVVGGEVASPCEQGAGHQEGDGEDRAEADEDAVDGATLERHGGLDWGGSGVALGDDWVTGDGCHGVLLCVEVYVDRTESRGAQGQRSQDGGTEASSGTSRPQGEAESFAPRPEMAFGPTPDARQGGGSRHARRGLSQ